MKKMAVALMLLVSLSGTARADVSPADRRAVSDQMINQMQQQYGPVTSVPPEQKAAQVFYSLLPYTQRHDVSYRLDVVQSRDINAYALPDGRVVMYSNLLYHLANDPNALAFAEAHEISHVEGHHADKKIEEQLGTAVVLGLAVRRATLLTQVAALATHQLIASGYSRQLETEADIHGLQLMREAGYDPNGALVVLRMLEELENKGGMRVFPNHPRAADRYANAIAWMNDQHIAIHEPNQPAPVSGYVPPTQTVPAGGPQMAGNGQTIPLPLPQVNYSTLTQPMLASGVFDTHFEHALANEIVGNFNQIVVDSHLSAHARNLTGRQLQSHQNGRRQILVAMVPGTWQFSDWKTDFETQFLPYIRSQAMGYDAIGIGVRANAGGTKQIIMVLGHLQ